MQKQQMILIITYYKFSLIEKLWAQNLNADIIKTHFVLWFCFAKQIDFGNWHGNYLMKENWILT